MLFQPLKIGPVTTKNRFHQVPHCTGMGYLHPRTLADMRSVMVTQRQPDDALYDALRDGPDLPFTLTRIGDCDAPAIIAAAVYAGHKYARELDAPVDRDKPLKHDRVDVGETPEGAHLR